MAGLSSSRQQSAAPEVFQEDGPGNSAWQRAQAASRRING